MKSIFYMTIIASIFTGLVYLLLTRLPEPIKMPVAKASRGSYSQDSFGSPRKGHSHRGVDIFARTGTPVQSATGGLVVYTGILAEGGKVVTVLSWKGRFHYYAHLDQIHTKRFSLVSTGKQIGMVGQTGNARNTPPHLHYSISYFSPGITYVNPVPLLNGYFRRYI